MARTIIRRAEYDYLFRRGYIVRLYERDTLVLETVVTDTRYQGASLEQDAKGAIARQMIARKWAKTYQAAVTRAERNPSIWAAEREAMREATQDIQLSFAGYPYEAFRDYGYASAYYEEGDDCIVVGNIKYGYPDREWRDIYATSIGWLRVEEAWQRRGIGTKLFSLCLEWINGRTYHTTYTDEGKAFTAAYHARHGTHPGNKVPVLPVTGRRKRA